MLNNSWLNKLNKNISYLVAVSGGPDSMFLLDNLLKSGFKIVVCHVNYQKRLSANVDQEILEEYCVKNNLTLEIKKVKKEEYNKTNFQDQARIIRYNFFNEIAHKYQIYNLVIAHHVYDLLETYLIQKQRRAIVSYYGLKYKTTYKSLSVYRPMLELKKEDILDYLTLCRIKYGFDETNDLDIYERNKIRHSQINKLTDFDINLLISEIKELNSELELVKDQLQMIYTTVINEDILSVTEFIKYNDNLKLQQMVIYEYLSNYDELLVLKVKKSKIKEIVKVLIKSKKPNIMVNLGDGVFLIKEYKHAYIGKKNEIVSYKHVVKKFGNSKFKELTILRNEPSNKQQKFQELKVSKEDFPLVIKINAGNEEISTVLGTKKINRLFIDNKIPYRKRMVWPVIFNSKGQVICIPDLAVNKNNLDNDSTLYIINNIENLIIKE